MKNIKTLILIIGIIFISKNSYSKKNDIWNDISQDAIQVKVPVEFIDNYGRYTVVGFNKKVKLVDFGNVEKNKKGYNYTLKNYGVQILNGSNVYNVFKTTTTLNSNVDFNLLYHDKNIVAFRIRDNSIVDYIKNPFKSFLVNTYVYNFNSNKFSTIPVLNSESDLDGKKMDLLQGDQLIFDSKKGIYTYLANIKYAKSGKIEIYKVELNNSLKCISASQGCENIGVLSAEIENVNK